jgi:plastocyanin
MMRVRVAAVLLAAAVTMAVGVSPAESSKGRHRQHCSTIKSRSRSASRPEGGWGATWGWGWQSGSFLQLTERRSAPTRRCVTRHRRKSTSRRGVSTTTPTVGAPSPSSGSPGTNVNNVKPAEVPSTPVPATGPSGGETTTEAPAPPSIPHVQVTAVEYRFTLSRTTVPAGKVDFDFVNSGQDEHNLNLASEGGSLTGSFPNTVSKGTHDLTFEMRPGRYTLFCSLPEHESKGMKATLTVE